MYNVHLILKILTVLYLEIPSRGGKIKVSKHQGGGPWMQSLLSDLGWPFQGGGGGGGGEVCGVGGEGHT